MRENIKEILKEVLWFSYENNCEVILTSSVIEIIRFLETGSHNENVTIKAILFCHINRYMSDEPNGCLKWVNVGDKTFGSLIRKDIEYIKRKNLSFPLKWFLLPLINFNKLMMSIESELDIFIYDIIFEIENEYRYFCNKRCGRYSSSKTTPVLTDYDSENDDTLKESENIFTPPLRSTEDPPKKGPNSIPDPPKKGPNSIPDPPKKGPNSIPDPPKKGPNSIPDPPKMPDQKSQDIPEEVSKTESYKGPTMGIGELLKAVKGISLEEAIALRRKSMRADEDESEWEDD